MNCSLAGAQPVFFESWFGNAEYDYARSVKQIGSGSVFVAGYQSNGPFGNYDMALHKLDRFGNLIWTKYFGDSLTDAGQFLNVCSDGNLLVCGEKQTSSNMLDAFLYKIDTAGNTIWYHTYGGLLNESVKYVSETQNGDFVLTGFVSGQGGNEIYVVRTDALGNERWSARYGGTDNEYADAIKELPDGDLIITADTKSFGMGGYDVELIRTDSLGNVQWDYTYGDQWQNGCQGILITSDMKFISYGETEISLFSAFDFYLEKIDTSGTSLWRRTFGGTNTADAAFSAIELPDGYMLCGYSNSYAQGPISVVVLKTDTAGQLLWAHPYGGPNIDIGYEIIASQNNGFYVIGTSNVNGDDQCYLLHVDGGGWAGITDVETKPEELAVYPNPVTNVSGTAYITVGLIDKHIPEVIKLIDMAGQVLELRPEAGSTRVALPETAKGIYIVEARSEGRVLRTKLRVF